MLAKKLEILVINIKTIYGNKKISVKLFKPINQMLEGLTGWITSKDGIQIKEVKYKAIGWKEERRFIVIRKNIEKFPKATGKLLLFKESSGRLKHPLNDNGFI